MSTFFKTTVLGVALGFAASFHAMAMPIAAYDASISATLSLTGVSVDSGDGPVEVDIFGEALIHAEDAEASGDATSSTGATVAPDFVSPLDLDPMTIDVKTGAAATGIGFAASVVSADGLVELFNASATNTVKLDFMFDYTISASASVTDLFLQAASANAYFILQNSQSFDSLLEIDLLAATDSSEPGGLVSDLFSFSIYIEPLSGESIFMLADVLGFLTSDLTGPPPAEIPIPSMAALFALSSLGLFLKRRRKAAS